MDLSVIIVSYNTAALTAECLASLYKTDRPEKEIFVVDNASIDNSREIIAASFPQVTLIANDRNRGFGAANNQALPYCRGRYVLFLNPDTSIKIDTLQKAVSFMDANPQVGMAGAKILNPDGTIQESVSLRYPGEKFSSGETAKLKGKIACVLGAFLIAPRTILEELQGFDEDFFLYGEDQDMAWRIREKGLSIGYIEDAEVLHWGAQSEKKTSPVSLFEKKLRAEYLFYKKHYSEQTIARIKRAQKIKAGWRLLTLNLLLPFFRDKEKAKNKIACYKLIYNLAR